MISLLRTNSDNPDFIALIQQLDAYLAIVDGEEHAFYNQFNAISKIKCVVVAYNDARQPIGCGAIREYAPGVMEVKRMYTVPESRGQGTAARVLSELEHWAAELSCQKCILETGQRQTDAVQFYLKNGYSRIPNYGQYAAIDNSVCFEKNMSG